VSCCRCVNGTPTTEIYTLSLHDALPIWERAKPVNTPMAYIGMSRSTLARAKTSSTMAAPVRAMMPLENTRRWPRLVSWRGRKLRSEEHTSELQSRENLVCRLLLEKKNNC